MGWFDAKKKTITIHQGHRFVGHRHPIPGVRRNRLKPHGLGLKSYGDISGV
jgi:hypothetical protein